MSVIKVVMHIVLPGSQMYTQEQAKDSPKECLEHQILWLSTQKWNREKKKKEFVKEPLHVSTRKCLPAHQTINMSYEAYEAMISKENIAKGFNKKSWDSMSKKQRMEAHLTEYCATLGGVTFTYDILPD